MSEIRKKPSNNLTVVLHAQVGNHCPLCTKSLTQKKNLNILKQSEIAHIYPLNPTAAELILLANEEVLNEDVNHEDNLIPLCYDCHGKYDKHKTVEEYRILVKIKKALIIADQQKLTWPQYSLQTEIGQIIDELVNIDESSISTLSYESKTIDEKLNGTITPIVKRKIHNHVQDYFPYIKQKLGNLERLHPTKAELISSQIKTYYLNQKLEHTSQEIIYKNISDWIMHKTKQSSGDASEILTAFFIQNCEIFG